MFGLLLATTLFLTSLNLAEQWRNLQQAHKESLVQRAAVTTSALVHELQKERGLSAGFIGSKGVKFSTELSQQHELSDRHHAKLKSFLAEMQKDQESEPWLMALQEGAKSLENISDTRNQIAHLSIPAEMSLAYYTGAIDRFLTMLNQASEGSSPAIARQIMAYTLLINAKEQAGRERATLNSVFASNAPMSTAVLLKLQSIITAQELHLSNFRTLVSNEQLQALDALLATPPSKETAHMRSVALDKAQSGNYGIEPAKWFQAISGKINALKSYEDELSASLDSSTQRGNASALRGVILSAVSAVGILSLGLVFYFIIQQMLRRIELAMEVANQLAAGNLDNSISLGASDETGQLLAAMQRMQTTIQTMVDDMNRMSTEHDRGDIEVVMDGQKFQGTFRTMAEGVNNMVNGHIAVKKKAMACIQQFGEGNLDAPLEAF
ncbi:nitrate- and nitrite sensing domain-containing protein, partial [Hydrogenophaga soli]